jgi:hypothetical protein
MKKATMSQNIDKMVAILLLAEHNLSELNMKNKITRKLT